MASRSVAPERAYRGGYPHWIRHASRIDHEVALSGSAGWHGLWAAILLEDRHRQVQWLCTVPDSALTPGEMDPSLVCVSNADRPRSVTNSEKDWYAQRLGGVHSGGQPGTSWPTTLGTVLFGACRQNSGCDNGFKAAACVQPMAGLFQVVRPSGRESHLRQIATRKARRLANRPQSNAEAQTLKAVRLRCRAP